MTETINLETEPVIGEDDTQPSEVQHQLEVAGDLSQEYDALLERLKLEPRNEAVKIFQALLRRNFVGFQTQGVGDRFSGTANVDATANRFKTVAEDSKVLTYDLRRKIIDWVMQQIRENPENGSTLYKLFLNRV